MPQTPEELLAEQVGSYYRSIKFECGNDEVAGMLAESFQQSIVDAHVDMVQQNEISNDRVKILDKIAFYLIFLTILIFLGLKFLQH